MENEELAALRATLLAAQRQPLAVKAAQARLSALLADGDELLPYVLSRSCSDPRDRTLEREEVGQLRVLEGGSQLPRPSGGNWSVLSAGLRLPRLASAGIFLLTEAAAAGQTLEFLRWRYRSITEENLRGFVGDMVARLQKESQRVDCA